MYPKLPVVAQPVTQSRPRALLRMYRREIKNSGNPGARLSLIGFSKKTIKVILIGPFKFARERLNVWRVWGVSGFSLRIVEVHKTGRFFISAIQKQHLHN